MNKSDITVMKFGGSCLKNPDDIIKATRIIASHQRSVVIVSAFNGITDELLIICGQKTRDERLRIFKKVSNFHLKMLEGITNEDTYRSAAEEIMQRLRELESMLASNHKETLDACEIAEVLSSGERLSATIVRWYLVNEGLNSIALETDSLGIITDDNYLNAEVDISATILEAPKKVLDHMNKDFIPVVTGFIGRSRSGKTSLLGRNSGDYSAAIVSHTLGAKELIFWKDVPGFMTADPKVHVDSKLIETMSYEQAMNYSRGGSKVLHPKVIGIAMTSGMPIHIKNFNEPGANGTTITCNNIMPNENTS
ncbi:MAG: aspartate kinase [Candidatus Thermoplasmatota archaeon]|nr:aspartate kinase [Candidatus Thermoplasmatota archaeon]MCL6089845.1 aspartate kinase [Candidatus Thermoplasmatota archaeon]